MIPSFCAKVWCFWIIACDLLSAFLSALRLVLHVNPWSQWKNLHTSKFGFCVDIYTCLPYVNTYIYYIWLKNDLYCYIISHLHLLLFKKQRILPPKNKKTPWKHKKNIGLLVSLTWFQPLEASWGSQPDSWHILRTWEPLITSGAASCGVRNRWGFVFWSIGPESFFLGERKTHGLNLRALQKPPWYGCFQK